MSKRFKEQLERNHDGRNVDEELGLLAGEGAQQKIKRVEQAFPTSREVWHGDGGDARTSYYARPAIKEPVWIWSIPVYFYVGGVTGAAGVLSAAAQLAGGEELRPFVRRLRWISAGGAVVSSGLLIYDLGRPERFLNMLRIFRPTSPMSVGAWNLAAVGGSSAIAALLGAARGALRRAGDAAGLVAAAFDLPFSGYTAVLVNNSAVPIWQGTRRVLPALFVASSATALGSLLQLLDLGPRERRIADRFARVGKTAEVLLTEAVQREAAQVPEVARPLHQGRSGKLWKAAKWMTLASLGLSLLPDRVRWARRASGLLGTASSLALRFAVIQAGRESARNPHATFEQQRSAQRAS